MLSTPAYASWFVGNLARSIALRPLSLSAAQELHALFNCAVERPKIGPVKRPCRLLWLMSRQLQNEPGNALYLHLGAAVVFALDWSLRQCARRLADVPSGGASEDVVRAFKFSLRIYIPSDSTREFHYNSHDVELQICFQIGPRRGAFIPRGFWKTRPFHVHAGEQVGPPSFPWYARVLGVVRAF